jgi:rod shape-determining protein MreD
MALGTLTTPVRRSDNLVARLLPVVTVLLAALLSILPLRIPGYAALVPAFTLMATYHWTVYRPDLLPATALFAIGLAEDLLAGGPLGATPLVLLIAWAVVLRRRRYFIGRPFPFVWTGFTILTGAALGLLWLLHCLLDAAVIDLRSTIFRAVLTISLFPAASFLLGRSQRAVIGAG